MTTPAVTGRTMAKPPMPQSRRFLIIAIILIVGFGVARSVFSHHDTTYEKIATQMTQALQNNDLAGVEKYQNAETATQVTHAIVGRDADVFKPLGKLERVRETAPADASETARRIHEFDATFANGVVHETIRFDPQDKVVGFKYELPAPK
jgi:hypothetical protein